MAKINSDDVVGLAIRSVTNSNKSYSVLPEGTWLAGGCGILADAVMAVWDYCGPELWAVRDSKTGTVHHIVVHLGRYYYDANGRATKQRLVEYWSREEGVGNPVVEPLRSWPKDIARDRTASKCIAEMFDAFFEERQHAKEHTFRR